MWQSDHEGIKATWLASDPESGVGGIAVAVGTTPGNYTMIWVGLDWVYD